MTIFDAIKEVATENVGEVFNYMADVAESAADTAGLDGETARAVVDTAGNVAKGATKLAVDFADGYTTYHPGLTLTKIALGTVGCAPESLCPAIMEGNLINCTDSDDSVHTKNEKPSEQSSYELGKVTAITTDGPFILEDGCMDGFTLGEFICVKTPSDDYKFYAASWNIKCENGCKDGACIK